MLDWDDLRVFAELARAGSLSAAARRLRADHSTVARRIDALEAALGRKLFDRLPRGYVLTAEGTQLAERTGAVEEAVAAVQRLADGAGEELAGHVRISAPPAIASHWLAARLVGLRRRHPDLVVELIGDAAAASLARREADIALRLSRPTDPALVARQLGLLRFGLYGARDYLAATPPEARAYIGYDDTLDALPQERWLRDLSGGKLAFQSNDLASLLHAARAGMGLAVLPHCIAADDPALACVQDASPATREIWLAVHPDLRRAARVRAVMDYLIGITAPLR